VSSGLSSVAKIITGVYGGLIALVTRSVDTIYRQVCPLHRNLPEEVQWRVTIPYTPMPLSRRTERTLQDIGYKPFHVYGFAYMAVPLAYSLRLFRCKHSRPKDSEMSP